MSLLQQRQQSLQAFPDIKNVLEVKKCKTNNFRKTKFFFHWMPFLRVNLTGFMNALGGGRRLARTFSAGFALVFQLSFLRSYLHSFPQSFAKTLWHLLRNYLHTVFNWLALSIKALPSDGRNPRMLHLGIMQLSSRAQKGIKWACTGKRGSRGCKNEQLTGNALHNPEVMDLNSGRWDFRVRSPSPNDVGR